MGEAAIVLDEKGWIVNTKLDSFLKVRKFVFHWT